MPARVVFEPWIEFDGISFVHNLRRSSCTNISHMIDSRFAREDLSDSRQSPSLYPHQAIYGTARVGYVAIYWRLLALALLTTIPIEETLTSTLFSSSYSLTTIALHHAGESSRTKIKKIASFLPICYTGDCNSTDDSNHLRKLLQCLIWRASYCRSRHLGTWTSHC